MAAELKAALRRKARRLQILALGVTHAAPFEGMRRILQERHRAGRRSVFEDTDIARRVEPEKLLPGVRSIISIAVSYHVEPLISARPPRTQRIAPLHRPIPDAVFDRPGRRSQNGAVNSRRQIVRHTDDRHQAAAGWISPHAWGRDYHRTVRDRLAALEAFLASHDPGIRCAAFVDTGPPVDRAAAERAGVGWVGKNCCLIVPDAGSWVVLGTLLTTAALPPDDEPVTAPFDACGDCDLCLRACPTGALVAPGQMEPSLCLAEATVMKGHIPEPLRQPLGNRVYGCDTCQQVCPFNIELAVNGDEAFQPQSTWDTGPDLAGLLQITKKEFAERYHDRASGWRGKRTLQRNAVIALGNYREGRSVPLLADLLLQDPRPVIRGAAAWALGRIGDGPARRALEISLAREDDPSVRDEAEAAWAALSLQ